MKKTKNLTVMLLDGGSRRVKTITFRRKSLHWFIGGVCVLFLGFLLVLTDYVSLSFDTWEFSELKKENQQLRQKFIALARSLEDLEKTVQQSQDFTKKNSANHDHFPRTTACRIW